MMKKYLIRLCAFLFIFAMGLTAYGDAWAQPMLGGYDFSGFGGSKSNSNDNNDQPPPSIARPSDTDYVDKTTDIMNNIKDNVAKGHDWSGYAGQSVNNSGSSENSAAQSTGSATSGNVEKYVGSSSLGDDYGYVGCGSGNIFQQLACRAGVIGRGLQSVGYIIAGFGLIVFSFAAIFGKVKWNVFATIMFSVFLLSMTVYVINTFTKTGDSSWIGGIKSTGYSSSENLQANVGNVDKVNVSQNQ